MKNVSAILTADLHITEKAPPCRLDNWMETQERKYAWLRKQQEKYDCPILCSGDLFDKWKNSPYLLAWALRNLPDRIWAIPGQHDLPGHSLDDIEKSSIQVLSDAGKIKLLLEDSDWANDGMMYQAFPWGTPLASTDRGFGEYSAVALIHYLVYQSKPPFPGAENVGGTAKSILKKMWGFDLILSGDNHQSFSEVLGNQVLVNSGSFMRTRADQIEHKPSIYLWCAKTNEVERVYIPIEKGVISRNHIDVKNDKNERIEAFVSKLKDNKEIGLSFTDNLELYLKKNKVSKSIEKVIHECLE